jgi:hypothetical protein
MVLMRKGSKLEDQSVLLPGAGLKSGAYTVELRLWA